MAGRVDPRRRGSYGIDAPFWAAAFVVFIAANIVNAMFAGGFLPYLPALFLLALCSLVLLRNAPRQVRGLGQIAR